MAERTKVGLVGTKCYADGRFDLPRYIVEAVAVICGRSNLTRTTDPLPENSTSEYERI